MSKLSTSQQDFSTVVQESGSWSHFQRRVMQLCHTFVISDFSLGIGNTEDVLKSSTFSSHENDDLKWCLEVYPNGCGSDAENHVSVYLRLVSCEERQVWVKFKFSILNAKREENNIMKSGKVYKFSRGSIWGLPRFINKAFLLDPISELLVDDKLILKCEATIAMDSKTVPVKSDFLNCDVPECTLSEDIGTLFDSSKFSDVILQADDTKFNAHKSVLAARSPVFAAMFNHDMKENEQNLVKITDINPQVLREMLRFIYTGTAPNLDGMADGLLVAADKYALKRLKAMCEENMCSGLTVENVLRTLVLADMHGAHQLKAYAIDFVRAHAADVVETKEWDTQLVRHPQLLAEITRALAKFPPPSGLPLAKRIKQT